jgi:sigma-B regulation protein RsbU (phosphoserine phosphatase)
LLDIVMPEIDGVEVCARIRKIEGCADVPIIMVTSLDDMSFLIDAFEAGANDHLHQANKSR